MPDRNPDLNAVAADVARAARDVAYVAVGAGVLGFQRAQVHRHELGKRLATARAAMADGTASTDGAGEPVSGLCGAIHALDKVVDDTVEGLVTWVEATVTPLEERLPEPGRTVAKQAHLVAKQAHVQAREARSQLRDRITGLAS